MKNRRKFGRCKGDCGLKSDITRYLLITSLVVQVIAAASLIAGCMPSGSLMDTNTPDTVIEVGGGSVPGQAALIPYARIINNVEHTNEWTAADNCFPGMMKASAPRRYKFILEWQKRPDSMTDWDVITRLNEVADTWREYEVLMEARPHLVYPPPLDGSKFEVANDDRKFKNDVVFQRYWPEVGGALPVIPPQSVPPWSLTDWQDSSGALFGVRQAQYALAKQYFETMLTKIRDSPYDDGASPLTTLYNAISSFIFEGSKVDHDLPQPLGTKDHEIGEPFEVNNDGFYWENNAKTRVEIDPDYSGPLFEIYFGFIPVVNGTTYRTPGNAPYPSPSP